MKHFHHGRIPTGESNSFMDVLPDGLLGAGLIAIIIVTVTAAKYGPTILEAWKNYHEPRPDKPWLEVQVSEDGRTVVRGGFGSEPRKGPEAKDHESAESEGEGAQ